MNNAPRLLDTLVSLTAIQDIELMEFSLMKTLAEFINPLELSILKLDGRWTPCYQLCLRKEKYEVLSENFSVSDEILSSLEIAQRTKQAFRTRIESGSLLSAWYIFQTRAQNYFLIAVTPKELTKLDLHMIKGLLQIYRNFYEVLSEAQRDPLTGLPNRKTFEEVVQKIYNMRAPVTDPVPVDRRARIDNENAEYWLGMADIDNFKRINDTWGHLYGDEVLLLLSQLMQKHFRESDFLFRFGGEEFVIIARAGNEEQAQQAFERFRAVIEDYEFPQVGQVTVSIGVVKMESKTFTTTLLDRADQALYYAKNNGRNRVEFFEELLETGRVKINEIATGEIELF